MNSASHVLRVLGGAQLRQSLFQRPPKRVPVAQGDPRLDLIVPLSDKIRKCLEPGNSAWKVLAAGLRKI